MHISLTSYQVALPHLQQNPPALPPCPRKEGLVLRPSVAAQVSAHLLTPSLMLSLHSSVHWCLKAMSVCPAHAPPGVGLRPISEGGDSPSALNGQQPSQEPSQEPSAGVRVAGAGRLRDIRRQSGSLGTGIGGTPGSGGAPGTGFRRQVRPDLAGAAGAGVRPMMAFSGLDIPEVSAAKAEKCFHLNLRYQSTPGPMRMNHGR